MASKPTTTIAWPHQVMRIFFFYFFFFYYIKYIKNTFVLRLLYGASHTHCTLRTYYVVVKMQMKNYFVIAIVNISNYRFVYIFFFYLFILNVKKKKTELTHIIWAKCMCSFDIFSLCCSMKFFFLVVFQINFIAIYLALRLLYTA